MEGKMRTMKFGAQLLVFLLLFNTFQASSFSLAEIEPGHKIHADDQNTGDYRIKKDKKSLVYIGSNDHTFYAINTENGKKVWQFSTSGDIYGASSAAISDDVVYIGSGDSFMYALDALSGQLKWKFKTNGGIENCPAFSGDYLYFGSWGYTFYCLDKKSGTLIWKTNFPNNFYSSIDSSPCISGDLVYFGSRSGKLYAYQKTSGKEIWNFPTKGALESSPIIFENNVLICSADGNMYAIDKKTGKQVWKTFLNTKEFSVNIGAKDSSPAISNGLIYIGSWNKNIYAFDVKTGKEIWRYLAPSQIWSSPCIVNNMLYIGCTNGSIYALDKLTGELVWKNTLQKVGKNNRIEECSPAYAEGTIFIASNNESLFALDALTGTEKWEFVSEGAIQCSPIIGNYQDNIPPLIQFKKPNPESWFKNEKVNIEGYVEDNESGVERVTIDDVPINVRSDGSFTVSYTLKKELDNLITGIVYDNFGNNSKATLVLNLDKTPPGITITAPALNTFTKEVVANLEFTVKDLESGVKQVFIKGKSIPFQSQGNYLYPLNLSEGKNDFKINAIDQVGNQSEVVSSLFLDSTPPLINVTFPQDNTELFAIATNARGSVTDKGSGLQSFRINQQEVTVNTDGTFLVPIPVLSGKNTYLFEATDKVGNTSQKTITVKGVEHIVVQLTIGSLVIIVNDKEAIIDAPPFIHVESKRTMVPVRFVVEPIGGNISFDAAEQKVTILREENQIELWVNRNTALINGNQVPVDVVPSLTPMIVSGRTFLPLRFVSENIGFKVDWDPKKYMVRLEFPDPDKKRLLSRDLMEAE
jgi:outer membrane protein assembly factor BamB